MRQLRRKTKSGPQFEGRIRQVRKAAGNCRKQLDGAYEILQHLCTHQPNPRFAQLEPGRSRTESIREFCARKVAECGAGEIKACPCSPLPTSPFLPALNIRPRGAYALAAHFPVGTA